MISHFHNLRRDQDGQSLVLACVALLVLALGVMTTVNLGRAVHQRIGLQNTADASAYSMAAIEARTFNFYAFSNRVQVAHYVSAMIFQSYISFFGFLQAFITDMVGFLDTLNQCNKGDVCLKVLCKALELIPVVGEIIAAVEEVIDAIDEAANALLMALLPIYLAADAAVGQGIIRALQGINLAMYAISKIMSETVALTVLPKGYPEVIDPQDDQVTSLTQTQQLALGALSAISYSDAHQAAAGGMPIPTPKNLGGIAPKLPDHNYSGKDDSEMNRAKRTMTEIVNATRYNNFVTDRSLGGFLPSFIPEPVKGIIVKFLNQLFKKYGQTKLVSQQVDTDTTTNYIRGMGQDASQLAQGNVLASDDIYVFGAVGLLASIPFASKLQWGEKKAAKWKDPPYPNQGPAFRVSIWAEGGAGGRGMHYRVVPNKNGSNNVGIKGEKLLPGIVVVCNPKVFKAYLDHDEGTDPGHPWMGITPFMNFAADTDQANFFGQPSTYSYINKPYSAMIKNKAGDSNRLKATTLGAEGAPLTVAGAGNKPAKIDTTDDINMPPPFSKGLNVMSRGMVYYHRPHNWEEPPNFFNPYWRAKLDPVALGFDQLASKIPGMSGIVSKLPIDQALVH